MVIQAIQTPLLSSFLSLAYAFGDLQRGLKNTITFRIYINCSAIYIYIYMYYLLVPPGDSAFLFADDVKLCSRDPNEVTLSRLFLPLGHWQWCGAYQYHSSSNLFPPLFAANANPMIPPVSYVGDLGGSP